MAFIHDTVDLLLSENKIRLATLNAKDASGQTPLHLVASFRYLLILRQLLNHGLDPSIRGADGRSTLHILLSSATHPHSEKLSPFNPRERERGIDEALFRRLLCAPVHGDTTTNNRSNQEDLVNLVNDPDSQGNTPLHLAAKAWLERSIAILLRLGGTPLARNHRRR
ncbi:hypothetical protein C8A03DRAFT_34900 [Achaetomium macrosporum]|uniref:Ankyrin n=1 Tax=Achaetomium macrosporum TaxID=79813 RepID=A0AAN7HB98_9PEZI|nr:hypothetical protein C8A03DRAFT_34900 [Achaetomium macrosporum]